MNFVENIFKKLEFYKNSTYILVLKKNEYKTSKIKTNY